MDVPNSTTSLDEVTREHFLRQLIISPTYILQIYVNYFVDKNYTLYGAPFKNPVSHAFL